MKKIFLMLALAGFVATASAQQTEEVPTLKRQVVTNNFWSNWFIDLGADHQAYYSNSEHGLGMNKNPFWTGRRSWGMDVSVGKWATPVFGARIKSMFDWGTSVAYGHDAQNNPTYNHYSFEFQPMLNLCNLFGGYKPRVYDAVLYAGLGFDHKNHTHDADLIGDLGLLNTFNITKRFHVNLDIYVRGGAADLDGCAVPSASDHRFIKNHDYVVGFSAGVGVNLGKTGWDKAPDVAAIMAANQSQVDALNSALADADAENARLRALIANHKCPEAKTTTVKEYTGTGASVFFKVNSSKIASKKDLVNVNEIAEFAKNNGSKIVVTGYADSKTGTAKINQALSEARANAVKKELVKMGVDESQIEVVAAGGVDSLNPYNYNRRATVTLK